MNKRLISILLCVVLVLGVFTACGSNNENTVNQKQDNIEENNNSNDAEENAAGTVYSSSASINLDKEYYYQSYKYLQKENSKNYGVDSADEIVFQSVYYDELCYLLSQEGTYLILFGGDWCPNTTSVIDYINYYANLYGVNTVYNFDFRLDGENRDSHIREDIIYQTSYTGEDKPENSLNGADYNYLYGELVDNFLTNINDWVEYQVGTDSDLTYLDVNEEEQTVAKVQVPFLFLYDKDNTVDNSGAVREEGYTNESGNYPIVYGFEKMVYRDSEGGEAVYTSSKEQNESTLVDDYAQQLENAIFKHIGDGEVTLGNYTKEDYIREAFEINERGHVFKTEASFSKDEQINIRTITYSQLKWLLQQEGNFLILFGGAWCANTQAAVATINDYAVENDLIVYMFDVRLDGKYPIDFWGYPRSREFQIRSDSNPFRYLYVDLITNYLTNLVTIDEEQKISYTDENGEEHVVNRLQAPYFMAYNKDAVDKDGFPAPVTGYYEEMLELIDTGDTYIYNAENYARYKAGTYGVITAYGEHAGITIKDITVDRAK